MPMDFLSTLGVLKHAPRQVWVACGVSEPESAADHMHQMAMICLQYPWSSESDRQRAIEMAIVYNAAKAVAGDLDEAKGITEENRHQREELAVEYLACLVREKEPAFADRLQELWHETRQPDSAVGDVVRQVDVFATLQQASVYARQYPTTNLSTFKASATAIRDPWLAQRAADILAEWNALDEAEAQRQSLLPVIFVIGGPGVGKGTQCARLAASNAGSGFAHISMGDLLRAEQERSGSQFGAFISKSIRQSIVVPGALAMMLLKRALESAKAAGKQAVLLDGFPRSLTQLATFEEEISERYATVCMNCSEDFLLQRLRRRAQTSGREDDKSELMRKRVDVFHETQRELLDALSKNSLETISCDGTVDEVQVLFRNAVDRAVQKQKTL